MKNYLLLLNILCSAFLAFQIQPILAKSILPTFGGGASVWTTSMLFFQGLLFLGYLHAYYVSLLKSVKLQLLLQLVLLLLSAGLATNLLTTPTEIISESPEFAILATLFFQIGLPFFVLSSTGVILQHWYALGTTDKTSVYPYYAWSNVGSLSALLAYPLLVEVHLGLVSQKVLWLGLYAGFVVINASVIFSFWRRKNVVNKPKTALNICTPAKSKLVLWVALAAAGVMMLLSTTHLLTLNISPMPFLWVLPFCLYLLSYILSFSRWQCYSPGTWWPMLLFCCCAALLMFFLGSQFNSVSQIVMYNFILFVTCMVCHGELRRHSPKANHLTLYYLCIAAGGLLGGIAVTLIAPSVFTKLTEYPLTMLFIYVLVACSYGMSQQNLRWVKSKLAMAWCLGLVVLTLGYAKIDSAFSRFDIASARNFYGYLSVKDIQTDNTTWRRLVDGTTVHGAANLNNTSQPTNGYYGSNSGIAIAIKHAQQQAHINMAVIGLGAGVLASYGRATDQISFYEINPNVAKFANRYFNYLALSPAKTEVILGDGRLSLETQFNQSGSQQLDLMVIDAFSSDAIPTHLITLEAFRLYWQHLRKNALLVIHVSNNHIDLTPVIGNLAKALNKQVHRFATKQDNQGGYASEWLVISANQTFFDAPITQINSEKIHLAANPKWLWTDDFNYLLSVIKI